MGWWTCWLSSEAISCAESRMLPLLLLCTSYTTTIVVVGGVWWRWWSISAYPVDAVISSTMHCDALVIASAVLGVQRCDAVSAIRCCAMHRCTHIPL